MSSENPYPHLFAPFTMNSVELPNRIVFAAHGSRFTDPHTLQLTPRQADYFVERVKGGAGLIIQGSAIVHPTGFPTAGINQIWDDSCIPAYRQVSDAVHDHGGVIFGQLSHLGREGHTFAMHRELWAPSAIPDPSSRVVPHEMTRKDIETMVECYRQGARRFVEAGYDGIEVYFAHGYLLCSFLSAFSNHRTDEFGGSLENRVRFPLACLEAVREEVGPHVPVGIRVSADEFSPNGLVVEETKQMVELVVDRTQVDYVSVSQSNYTSIETMIPDMSFPRRPFVHFAGEIRKVSNGVPVMAVGRIITPEACEELIAGEVADFVCLVRPLIADPQFPRLAREGRREDIRECISCNVGCRGGPHRGGVVACLVNPTVGFEAEWGVGKIQPVEQPGTVLVVGGGPGGLKAAETAALRGHQVTLLEASERLGGAVLTAAAAMPYRDEFANSVRFLERQVRKLGVNVELGVRATPEHVASLAPDAVIVATGARAGRPDIPGADLPHVFDVADAIAGRVVGSSVVLVDSGEADWRVLTTAERLAADGHQVRIVGPVPMGAEIDAFSRPPLLRRLRRAGVEFVEYHSLVEIGPGVVRLRDNHTAAEEESPADAVVFSWFGVADDSLFHELDRIGGMQVRAVGDCLAPRRAIDAIWDGFRIGMSILTPEADSVGGPPLRGSTVALR
jgi:2,4-dienoyl-CoA reductase-like NADH-dependent reductase (Old Yellow Enzyme family)/thioredoxin reductase